ncbi:DNA replication complex GINS family protein [Halobacteriaceae bacterium SHR40]|uniref:DNA replication complex subunit Gins51 n=1 Tax=Halovenus amylolytica TaxID=2500550 RepID=UPI000FE401B3
MNLEELQTARDRERQTDKLQQLRESFYSDAGEFIQQLRAERDRAADRADDPFDAPEVNQLTDEINTAEQTVEAIYEKRVGKIVKAASFAAADLPAEADGMTAEEQELFDTLVDNIKGNREQVMATLAGEETQPEPVEEATEPAETGVSAADLMGTGEETAEAVPQPPEQSREQPEQPATGDPSPPTENTTPPEPESQAPTGGQSGPEADDGASEPAEGAPEEAGPQATEYAPPAAGERTEPTAREPDSKRDAGEQPKATAHQGEAVRNDGGQPPGQQTVERRTVRVTDDIETFVGSDDRDYDLKQEDIVMLPEPNATLLIERDAAEQL